MTRKIGELASALLRGAGIAALLALIHACAILAGTHFRWYFEPYSGATGDPAAYAAAQLVAVALVSGVMALAAWSALLLAGARRLSGAFSRLRRAAAGDLSAPTRLDAAFAGLAGAVAASALCVAAATFLGVGAS